jgi:sugar phosphate isomerase/epimerase
MAWPERLSFNQYTASGRQLDDWLPAAARAGVRALGLSRRMLSEYGIDKALQMVRDTGIPVSSYTAVGYWASGYDSRGNPRPQSDNIKALDEAVSVGTKVVCVTSGGLRPGDKDFASARARCLEGLRDLVPHAAERNLTLAVEGVHPVFGPRMGVWLSFDEVMDVVAAVNSPVVSVFLDTLHTWWDYRLAENLRRARGLISLVQINDWAPELAANDQRAMMGDGCIDFGPFYRGLEDYDGWFEGEVLNDGLKAAPFEAVLDQMARAYENTFGRWLAGARK